MSFTSLELAGLRGFSAPGLVPLAQPTGLVGSGLTVLVGPNNAGKSTIIEALAALSRTQVSVSFNSGVRNREYGDRVVLSLRRETDEIVSVKSLQEGTSQTRRDGALSSGELLVVPSRRSFAPFFSDNQSRQRDYSGVYQWAQQRSATIPGFESRLFKLQENEGARSAFNEIFDQVVGAKTRWTIDQSEQGQFYLKFKRTDISSHSSDGLGEGLVSLLFIADALYDSEPGSFIVFDEPELSLHPQFQRRLRATLSQFATDRQILYSTHSPYFISWEDIAAGASISRVVNRGNGSEVHTPQRSTLDWLARSRKDIYNPHSLGLNAAEVFFLEDRVLLTEGQEDVVLLPSVFRQVGVDVPGDFYGWGAGGAEKISGVMQLLKELGYQRVVAILDGDKSELALSLKASFPTYWVAVLPAPDVRDKGARGPVTAKRGLLDEQSHVHDDLLEPATRCFVKVRDYLGNDPAGAASTLH